MVNHKFLDSKRANSFLSKKDDFIVKNSKSSVINFLSYCELIYYNNLNDHKNYLRPLETKEFSENQKKHLNSIMTKINQTWSKLNLPNLNINFILTNGNESFGMPYTRGKSIILNQKYFKKYRFGSLNTVSEGLIVHEMFHILSRKNPQLKEVIYKSLGFYKIKEVKHPSFVTNPDCPDYDWAIGLKNKNTNMTFEAVLNVSLFNKSELSGKEVFNNDEKWFVNISDTNLKELIKETDYLIHPEEIAAEYFRQMFYFTKKNQLFGLFKKNKPESISHFQSIIMNFFKK